MNPTDFKFLADLVYKQSGLVLTDDKGYLIETRLLPIARKWNLGSIADLVASIKSDQKESLIYDVVEAMTTNESFFFRDTKPFDQFRDFVMPKLMAEKVDSRPFRIWSAACSSGQEAYSLSMILKENAKLSTQNVEIVGTDISRAILEKAKNGVYSQFEVQRGLPIMLLMKYFDRDGDHWKVKPILKSNVQFKEFNLLKSPVLMGKMDVIFCRNVLIYFDKETKTKVLAGLASIMNPNGYLFLGGAETVIGITDKFSPVPDLRGVYALSSQATILKKEAAVY